MPNVTHPPRQEWEIVADEVVSRGWWKLAEAA
jgi:hypothetical protein